MRPLRSLGLVDPSRRDPFQGVGLIEPVWSQRGEGLRLYFPLGRLDMFIVDTVAVVKMEVRGILAVLRNCYCSRGVLRLDIIGISWLPRLTVLFFSVVPM